MNRFILLALSIVAIAVGHVVRRQAQPMAYSFSDGAELILGGVVGGFSCENRIYGYYADQANGCRVFHVCVPVVLADGVQQTTQYSFFCGNQTVFDQQHLVCSTAQEALPCEEAAAYYSVNEFFGRTDRPLLRA